MTPAAADSPHALVSASGVLLGTLLAAMAAGALLGWAAGSWPLGLVGGAIVGVPAGVIAVYFRFRSFFAG